MFDEYRIEHGLKFKEKVIKIQRVFYVNKTVENLFCDSNTVQG